MFSQDDDILPLHGVFTNITVLEQVAMVEIDQTFYNDTDEDTVFMYCYPVPSQANVTGFGIWQNGDLVYYELQPGEHSGQGGEGEGVPGLADYLGDNPFYSSLYNLPHGEFTIRFEYTELLEYSFGQYLFSYPLDTEGFMAGAIDTVNIDIEITSQRTIESVEFSNYPVEILSQTDNDVVAQYQTQDLIADLDLLIATTISQNETGMWVMTYCENPDSMGYYLAILEPGDLTPDCIFQKNFTFVFDASRSMLIDQRIQHATESAIFCIQNLNETDFFNIVTFNDLVVHWQNHLVIASEENKLDAISFLENIELRNGTDLNSGMLAALNQEMSDSAANQLLLLSDGRPEAVPGAEMDLPTILENIQEANTHNASIFTVGVGDPGGYAASNLDFMRMIAYQNNGMGVSIPNDADDVVEQINDFTIRFMNPAAIDITLDYGSIDVWDVYPPEPYSIFASMQTIVTGRFLNSGTTDIQMNGRIVGEDISLSYGPFTFSNEDDEYTFIPRLWAINKIDYWLAWMSVYGEDQEIIDMIIYLSMRYGILTPYTSYETPVEDVSLQVNAHLEDSGVQLDWSVSCMMDSLTFDVYRKTDDSNTWLRLNDTPITRFSFLDTYPPGGSSCEYRIVMMCGTAVIAEGCVTLVINGDWEVETVSVFPNPFNSITQVNITLQHTADVKLELYNILGQRVSTIIDSRMEAGATRHLIDGNSLSSGVYFLRFSVQAGNSNAPVTSLQRLILIK